MMTLALSDIGTDGARARIPTLLRVNKTTCLKGTIKAPPSKSYTHRAIVIGSMNGRSSIINPLVSHDTIATIEAWKQLGSSIHQDKLNSSLIDSLIVNGFGGHPKLDGQTINVGEAGTLLRFALAVAALGQGSVTFEGEGTLSNRSNSMIVEPLRKLGVRVEAKGPECYLPITVHGTGSIQGGRLHVTSDMSSQVLSALLIASPTANNDTLIKLDGQIVSRPYVDITIDVLKQAGIDVDVVTDDSYQSFKVASGQTFGPLSDYRIHGDYSSAAFLLAAACMVDSDVTITDLVEDRQGDRCVIDILERMGAIIERGTDYVRVQGPFKLHGIEINCRHTPDLVPALAALASMANGRTRIYDIAHLRYKESNRILSTVSELSKLGVQAQSGPDEIIIDGSDSVPRGGEVSSCSDHRIAMALSLVGLVAGDVRITGAECIAKSYPDFVEDMKSLGAAFQDSPE